MTREEAIELLDNLVGIVEDNQDSDYDIALKMAIEALRPDGDTISRQGAIDTICKACSMEGDYHKCDGYPETSTWCDELVALRAVPSAEPLTEGDYSELRNRFGEYVELFVRDMITGNGERWNGITTGISVFSPLKYHLSYKEPKKGHWIMVQEELVCKCSCCGCRYSLPFMAMKYCCKCGAKMEVTE